MAASSKVREPFFFPLLKFHKATVLVELLIYEPKQEKPRESASVDTDLEASKLLTATFSLMPDAS